MSSAPHESTRPALLARSRLQELIDALRGRGFRVLGPVRREEALAWDEVRSVSDLPLGWRERQGPGHYRLESTGSQRVFDIVNGPGSLKPFFFAPREPLLQIEFERCGGTFTARPERPSPPATAWLGVRACDLAALRVQDRVFLHDRFPDAPYETRRSHTFFVAVSCTRSASTCFCTSMGTGPEATAGFDLALTELEPGFLVRSGTAAGADVLAHLALPPAGPELLDDERTALRACSDGMQRQLDTSDLPELLYSNLEHPRWDEVAERCLSCANCTLVCPTCFCHDEWDEPSVDGKSSLRVREWDSCFNRDHAQVHGTNFRPRIAHRYRQWLVHKLASWIDQFGSSGCVGCGRCISWCPVGIDLTEEIAALRAHDGTTDATRNGPP